MENNITLTQLHPTLKKFLAAILFSLFTGITVGVVYLSQTTHLTPEGTIERYKGSEKIDELALEVSYSKSLEEMLITTHSHIISFSLILGMTGIIFYFAGMKEGFMKSFLLVEPPISAVVTFMTIWGMRFISHNFVYITIISGVLLYTSLYFMIIYSFVKLIKKRAP